MSRRSKPRHPGCRGVAHRAWRAAHCLDWNAARCFPVPIKTTFTDCEIYASRQPSCINIHEWCLVWVRGAAVASSCSLLRFFLIVSCSAFMPAAVSFALERQLTVHSCSCLAVQEPGEGLVADKARLSPQIQHLPPNSRTFAKVRMRLGSDSVGRFGVGFFQNVRK